MTSDFILERLEVISGSSHQRESGNETITRMLTYLSSHKKGNEEEIRAALDQWIAEGADPKFSMARTLKKDLAL